MQPWSLIILYAGLGLALALLRRQQGACVLDALVDGLFWPMEFLRTGLLLIAHGLEIPLGYRHESC